HALWSYARTAASKGNEAVDAVTSIRGPATGMMFVAAVTVDPKRQEIYTVDNDIGDRMMVFPYDANGNIKPSRALSVPHQAWGRSTNRRGEGMGGAVEGPREIAINKRNAKNADPPVRIIRGPKTGLGDPHGVYYGASEIVVANHGNQNGRYTPPGDA